MNCRTGLALSIAVLVGVLGYFDLALHFEAKPSAPATERHPASWTMIRIGMAAADVHRNMGPPFACTVSGAGMEYFADENTCFDIAKARRTPVSEDSGADVPLDVYHWQTALNDYEFHIFFAPDDRQSSVHPIYRVSHFDVVLAKTMPVSELVSDMPDPLNWCSASCRLILETNDQSAIGLGPEFTLIAYSPQPDVDSAELAAFSGMGGFDRIARARASAGRRHVKADWVPAVFFSLDSSAGLLWSRSPTASEWLSARAKFVQFGADALAFENPIVDRKSLGSFRELLSPARLHNDNGH
jgi:hypothetical protein